MENINLYKLHTSAFFASFHRFRDIDIWNIWPWKIGQGHRVQHWQCRSQIANVKIYKRRCLHFLFSPRFNLCERLSQTHTQSYMTWLWLYAKSQICLKVYQLQWWIDSRRTQENVDDETYVYIIVVGDMIIGIHTDRTVLSAIVGPKLRWCANSSGDGAEAPVALISLRVWIDYRHSMVYSVL